MSGNPRNAGPRPDARRDFALLNVGWRFRILHYMGCSTFANHTVLPEIALAKVSEDAPIPKSVEGDLAPYLVDLTRGGADYTFDATGNVGVMRDALESAHKGWGESIIIGVSTCRGRDFDPSTFQLHHRQVVARHRLWRRAGPYRRPKIVYWYMDGKRDRPDDHSHHVSGDINHGFDLMHKGVSI